MKLIKAKSQKLKVKVADARVAIRGGSGAGFGGIGRDEANKNQAADDPADNRTGVAGATPTATRALVPRRRRR